MDLVTSRIEKIKDAQKLQDFKYWDTVLEKFIDKPHQKEGFLTLQYIGKKDSENNKVYQGDIVEIWSHGDKETSYVDVIDDIRRLPNQMFGSSVDRVLIIGNIFQNPEKFNIDD